MEKRRGKSTKSEISSYQDFISRLPDDVLTHILSYLPTKSSVATCVLSKRWSRLWISVPNLDFHGCSFSSSVSRAQFENFMDRFLSLSNVRSVRMINLHMESVSEVSRVIAWLAAFGERNAEKIDLTLGNSCSLPDTFFNQNTLVKLKLTTVVLRVPQLVCFPKLKEMYLRSVQFFDDTSMKNLLCGSPVLTNLCIDLREWVEGPPTLYICSSSLQYLQLYVEECNSIKYNVVIDTPQLRYLFHQDCDCSSYDVVNVSSLERADLTIQGHDKISFKVLRHISNVKELVLSVFLTNFESTPLPNLPIFRNLIRLEAYLDYVETWEVLFHLLQCTPNLVTLILEAIPECGSCSWCEPDEVPQCFVSSIQNVEFKEFIRDGEYGVEVGDEAMQMISYALKNALVLKKLSFHSCGVGDLVEKNKICKTLLSLPKSSAICVVECNLR